MDPVSRRFVWQHLDEIKKDCTILLTTHAMEEADLLSDEVAIMKSGQVSYIIFMFVVRMCRLVRNERH